MWECNKCHERIEDSFDACWNCGTSRDGVEDPSFRKGEDPGEVAHLEGSAQQQESATRSTTRAQFTCSNCQVAMEPIKLI